MSQFIFNPLLRAYSQVSYCQILLIFTKNWWIYSIICIARFDFSRFQKSIKHTNLLYPMLLSNHVKHYSFYVVVIVFVVVVVKIKSMTWIHTRAHEMLCETLYCALGIAWYRPGSGASPAPWGGGLQQWLERMVDTHSINKVLSMKYVVFFMYQKNLDLKKILQLAVKYVLTIVEKMHILVVFRASNRPKLFK